MLTRRHIRIKVMQSLYAFDGNESSDITKSGSFLTHSLSTMYDLYLVILCLLIEIHKKAKNQAEKGQKKFLATSADINPNTKFIDNFILNFISQNELLNESISNKKLNYWDIDFEYVDIIFNKIKSSEVYKSYMNDSESNFEKDQQLIIDLYTQVIAPNDKLYEFIEDKRLTWMDDFPIINTLIVKLFKKIRKTSSKQILLPKLYKDDGDQDFAKQLFTKSILKHSKLSEEISGRTKNWDAERLASIDGILLKMAICEFQEFPTIPFKVTINEYLEIAKEYSTPKSSFFINGILDRISKEYQNDNLHKKIGRGLR